MPKPGRTKSTARRESRIVDKLHALNLSRGQMVVLLALAIVTLLGVMSLSIDVAVAYVNQARVQSAADAAALAGVAFLPGQPSKAAQNARSYANQNGLQDSEIQSISVAGDSRSITLTALRQVPSFFARLLSFDQFHISVRSKASVQPVGQNVTGTLPIGLDQSTPYSLGQSVTLHGGSPGQCGPGNFVHLALADSCEAKAEGEHECEEEHEDHDEECDHDADEHEEECEVEHEDDEDQEVAHAECEHEREVEDAECHEEAEHEHDECEEEVENEHGEECDDELDHELAEGSDEELDIEDDVKVMDVNDEVNEHGLDERIEEAESDHPDDDHDDYELDDKRTVTVALVDCTNGPTAEIKGFAELYLDDVEGSEIHAHFTARSVHGEADDDAPDYGAHHARLEE